MSCNHCATASAAAAARTGHPEVEATWAENREHPRFCPTCHGFLRRDGGCTICEEMVVAMAWQNPASFTARYRAGDFSPQLMRDLAPVMADSPDPAVRFAAATNLNDSVLLGNLADDPIPVVQAAVAGNRATLPPTLQRLLNSPEPSVYRAAAFNPGMPPPALKMAGESANKQWLTLAQKAIQPLIYQRMFSSGRGSKGNWFLPTVMVGMYGPAIYKVWRRKRTIEQAIAKQQNSPSVPTPAIVAPRSPRDRRFNDKERRLIEEELKIAESSFTLSDDYYDGMFTVDDVFYLRENGADSDRMAEISGYLLNRAAETARQLPGWYEQEGATVEDFERMQQKLRCQTCGRYAGWRSHQCEAVVAGTPASFGWPAGVSANQ